MESLHSFLPVEFEVNSIELAELTSSAVKEGFMIKKGHVRHNWKTRWFVLQKQCLLYFTSRENPVLKGSINLKGCSVVSPCPEYTKKEYVFRIIEICGTEYLLQCSSEDDRDSWVREIGCVIRNLDTVTKSHLKISDRKQVVVPQQPNPDAKVESTDSSELLVILQNRVSHEDLLSAMQDVDGGVALQSYTVDGETFKHCFTGAELVTWLLSWNFVVSREEGRVLAGELLENAYLHPVSPLVKASLVRKAARKVFADDDSALYRFSTLTPNTSEVDFDISDSSDESDDGSLGKISTEEPLATTIKQGFLVKKGHVRHNWKVRKFLLQDEPARLVYHNAKRKDAKRHVISLYGCKVRSLHGDDLVMKTACIKGYKKVVRQHCFMIKTSKNLKYVMQAPTEGDMLNWLALLQQVISKVNKCEDGGWICA